METGVVQLGHVPRSLMSTTFPSSPFSGQAKLVHTCGKQSSRTVRFHESSGSSTPNARLCILSCNLRQQKHRSARS